MSNESDVQEKDKEGTVTRWYGSSWLEFFIAFILARLAQTQFDALSGWGIIVLLPLFWFGIHYFLGSHIEKIGKIKLW